MWEIFTVYIGTTCMAKDCQRALDRIYVVSVRTHRSLCTQKTVLRAAEDVATASKYSFSYWFYMPYLQTEEYFENQQGVNREMPVR